MPIFSKINPRISHQSISQDEYEESLSDNTNTLHDHTISKYIKQPLWGTSDVTIGGHHIDSTSLGSHTHSVSSATDWADQLEAEYYSDCIILMIKNGSLSGPFPYEKFNMRVLNVLCEKIGLESVERLYSMSVEQLYAIYTVKEL